MEQPSPDAGQKALAPRLTPAAQARKDLIEDVYSRRLKGESVPEIAKELGLTPKRVSTIVDKEVRSRPIPSMIAYRRILLDRYEKMARKLEPHARGEGIDPRSGEEYDRPQLGFVDRWLALQDKIGKLVGANAPVQVGVEHSGEVVHTHDVTRLISDRLAQMRENLDANQAALHAASLPLEPAQLALPDLARDTPVEGEIVEDTPVLSQDTPVESELAPVIVDDDLMAG